MMRTFGLLVLASLCMSCGDLTGPQLHEQATGECGGEVVNYISFVIDLRVDPPTVQVVTDSVRCVESDG